ADGDAGQQERDAEPERIDAEQAGPLPGSVLHRGDGEDGGEDGADAGRPADRESEAEQEAAERPAGDAGAVVAQLAIEEADPEYAEEMQAHGDDENAGDWGDDRQSGAEGLA